MSADAQTVPFDAAVIDHGGVWDQGVIVDGMYFWAVDAEKPAVLVTPACDVAQDKVPYWTFVALFRDTEVTSGLLNRQFPTAPLEGLSAKQRRSCVGIAEDLVGQRLPRYHWLPIRLGGHFGYVADFALVQSGPVAEIRARLSPAAKLASSWREQLPVRYAAYMGRIGTDDFARDALAETYGRLVDGFAGAKPVSD